MMLAMFALSNIVTAGLTFIVAAAVLYNVGRRDERAALQRQRASSAAVRGRLAALALKAAVQAPHALPAAKRDHAAAGELRLKPIKRSASMGRD